MQALVPRFDRIFERIIGERLKVGEKEDGKKKERKDFLQFLLDLKDSESADSKTPFTMTHVKALLMVPFLISLSNFNYGLSSLHLIFFLEFYLFFLKLNFRIK